MSPELEQLLHLPRPDGKTWAAVCTTIDKEPLPFSFAVVQMKLRQWPREVPRPAPKHWRDPALLSLCLDVAENEQLYHHYVTGICGSPRLRLSDGSPAVSLWRQPRGVVTLQAGGQVTLGAGQPGLADLGGVMTVETSPGDATCTCGSTSLVWRHFLTSTAVKEITTKCTQCHYVVTLPTRFNLYIEIEVKLDGKIPPGAQEYRGSSKRGMTQTEQDQCQRQQAMLRRGGCYIFAERTAEAIEALVQYRDEVLARMS